MAAVLVIRGKKTSSCPFRRAIISMQNKMSAMEVINCAAKAAHSMLYEHLGKSTCVCVTEVARTGDPILCLLGAKINAGS